MSLEKKNQNSLPLISSIRAFKSSKSKYKLKEDVSPEPLLSEESKRYALFPIKYNDIWKMYKKAEASFWTTEELDLVQDMRDWKTLSKNEQFFRYSQIEAVLS